MRITVAALWVVLRIRTGKAHAALGKAPSLQRTLLCCTYSDKETQDPEQTVTKINFSFGKNVFSKVTDSLLNIFKPQLGLCKSNSIPPFNQNKSFHHCFKTNSWKPYLQQARVSCFSHPLLLRRLLSSFWRVHLLNRYEREGVKFNTERFWKFCLK